MMSLLNSDDIDRIFTPFFVALVHPFLVIVEFVSLMLNILKKRKDNF